MTFQRLTFHLEGMTAADYLAYVRDPEPPGLGRGLRSITVEAEPLGSVVDVVLAWDGLPPAPHLAAVLAGLPTPAEVVSATGRTLESVAA